MVHLFFFLVCALFAVNFVAETASYTSEEDPIVANKDSRLNFSKKRMSTWDAFRSPYDFLAFKQRQEPMGDGHPSNATQRYYWISYRYVVE